jgi:hypothetical protein
MKHQRHFENANETALREAVQIRILIADLDRVVQIINCNIAAEKEQARVSDRSDAAYPMLARTLSARRDNLTPLLCLSTDSGRSINPSSNSRLLIQIRTRRVNRRPFAGLTTAVTCHKRMS